MPTLEIISAYDILDQVGTDACPPVDVGRVRRVFQAGRPVLDSEAAFLSP